MRSAYSLEAGRDVNWRRLGLCGEHPDLWSADSWTMRSHAAHVCLAHCPVLEECHADMKRTPKGLLQSVVVAGVAHGSAGDPITWPTPPMRCTRCRTWMS